MGRKIKCVMLWLLLLVGLSNCRTQATAPPTVTPLPTVESLLIGLSDGASLLPGLISDYRPKAQLTFPQTNDATLFADLDAGLADALLVHNIPASRDDIWFNPVAVDGIVVIVHPNNQLTDLTLAQVQALFSANIDSWDALGGQAATVHVLIQEEGSGVRALFERFVMTTEQVAVSAQVRPKPAALIEAVAEDEAAIGYVTIGALPPDTAVKVLTIDQFAATATTLGTQEYPLSLPLYWVSEAEPQGELRELLGWLQSVAGQEALGTVFGRIR